MRSPPSPQSRPSASGSVGAIQHLQAEEKSHLPEILDRCTSMSVQQVNQPTPLEPDHIYVIPPGRVLELRGSTLELFVITFNDVTELKQAQERERRLATVVDAPYP